MSITVRLDPKTEGIVRRLAFERARTKSQVIRDAIKQLAAVEEASPARGPYEAMKHLIGTVRGGPPDLSERTGEKVRVLLAVRRRR